MIDDLLIDAKDRMTKTVESTGGEFATVRTGRATPHLLDRIMVERGRSLNWLADQVGITNVNLSKIKNNRVSAIRFSALAAICAALDCQPGDILEYVDGISGDADDANSK